MGKFLSLIAGGAIGTLLRYFMSGWTYRIAGTGFPHGTFVVNVAGCFIIGFLVSVTEKKFLLSPNARLLLMVGFCGAFTTFSTFIMETAHLIRDGETLRAFINVLVSVVIGFGLFRTGVLLGDLL